MAPQDPATSVFDHSALENASRGLISRPEFGTIENSDGIAVWKNQDYDFLKQDCAETVHPKLWRQGQLTSMQGLFEVTSGIYQIRGYDISNMTLIESNQGVIVLDCLASLECSRAALEFYHKHRGLRKVKALLYSHSHYDHFGGAKGVVPTEHIPIIAPFGFTEEVLLENVVAGPAMRRRAISMFGTSLSTGPHGHVGCGLGMAASTGTTFLVPPNDFAKATGETRTIDGVTMEFQMVPGAEAPCEFNVWFPEKSVVYVAECATHTMHNIVTLRGAQVRDAKLWSKYLDETIELYNADILIAGHHWPTWGRSNVIAHLSDHRDLYAYTHDQTVRMINEGQTAAEIAEQLRLPADLRDKWYMGEYYGALSQNVKGIYQRYMTWFDGNAANLWRHPPVEEAKRYVSCMGGVEAVLQKAQQFVNEGDLRFAATILDHVVSSNDQGKYELADVYEALAFGAENAVWRNFYLTAAQQLRSAETGTQQSVIQIDRLSGVETWLDALSIRLDGIAASGLDSEVTIAILDEQELWRIRLRNSALTYRCQSHSLVSESEEAGMNLSRSDLFMLITEGQLDTRGDASPKGLNDLKLILRLCSVKT